MSSFHHEDLFAPDEVVNGRFRIVRLIGKGGMGEVYEAFDVEKEERVALKTVLPELLGSSKILARFEREIEFSQRISHPNVLRIISVFRTRLPRVVKRIGAGPPIDMAPCMVMELLEGETIADHFVAGKLFAPEEAKPLVCQMASALGAAHGAGIVHRDLKPDNIFLVPGESQIRVVLTDFGVARHANKPNQEDSLTASNVLLGTPTYMAPEQLELEEAMPASDIYTLGLVIFEMLTGKPPFEADSPIKMVFKRVQEDPPSPREYIPDLDERWVETIMRCLEREPTDRFENAQDIINVLDGDESQWLVDHHKSRQKTVLWLTMAVISVALIVALIFFVP